MSSNRVLGPPFGAPPDHHAGQRRRSWARRLSLSAAVRWFVFLACLLAASPAWADITYVYDSLGRLVGVVDPAGDTVVYQYDAVGNLLSISRQSSSLVSIIKFTPGSGPVGTTVTIFGTGFSPTPSQNTVTFNGTTASVTSSTATQIVTSVPVGATTGSIAVTAPAGSATSASPFTVTSSSGAPTITNFTPTVATPGTAVTITGTNFETIAANNRLDFNITHGTVSSATATTLATTVPTGGTSGRLTLATPGGQTQSAADFFVPPPPWTAADVAFTGRIATGGSSLSVPISPNTKIALVVFDATAGQRLGLVVSGSTGVESDGTIYRPDGASLQTQYIGAGGGTLDTAPLPATGTYTFFLKPRPSWQGSATLTLSEEISAGAITIGGAPVTVSITRAGVRARLTFSGTAGQRLDLGLTGITISSSTVSILNPDGTTLVSANAGTPDTALDTPPLPVTGTYTILVDPAVAATGNMTLTLSEEVTGTITVGGASAPVSISRAGQRARYTFSGTAGQRLSLGLTSVTISSSFGFIYKPDGSLLMSQALGTANTAMDLPVLPTTGTYTILIDPSNAYTGSVTLTLSEEVTGTITPGGPAVPVSITRAGQRARISFDGTAGQRVSLKMTSVTITQSTVSLLNPDGTTLASITVTSGSTGFIDVKTLVTTGTYAILINPAFAYTGNMTLTLYDVPPDLSGALTVNGAGVAVTLSVPGQNATYTFNGTAGQPVTARVVNNTMGCVTISVIEAGGATAGLVCSSSGNVARTLSANPGTPTVKVDPSGANTGTLDLNVTSP